MMTHLFIKNMVCARCVRIVREELERLGLTPSEVVIGEATIEHAGPLDRARIRETLQASGFDLIEDKKATLIEQIKIATTQLVHSGGLRTLHTNFSDYLSKLFHRDYHYLSSTFSQHENLTLEKYLILQKIERAKELLIYGDLSLAEIARELGYGNAAYLSGQFKQITGFSPREFKKLKSHERVGLDQIGTNESHNSARKPHNSSV